MGWGMEIGTPRKFEGDMEFAFGNISDRGGSNSVGMYPFPLVWGRESAFGMIDGMERGL